MGNQSYRLLCNVKCLKSAQCSHVRPSGTVDYVHSAHCHACNTRSYWHYPFSPDRASSWVQKHHECWQYHNLCSLNPKLKDVLWACSVAGPHSFLVINLGRSLDHPITVAVAHVWYWYLAKDPVLVFSQRAIWFDHREIKGQSHCSDNENDNTTQRERIVLVELLRAEYAHAYWINQRRAILTGSLSFLVITAVWLALKNPPLFDSLRECWCCMFSPLV